MVSNKATLTQMTQLATHTLRRHKLERQVHNLLDPWDEEEIFDILRYWLRGTLRWRV